MQPVPRSLRRAAGTALPAPCSRYRAPCADRPGHDRVGNGQELASRRPRSGARVLTESCPDKIVRRVPCAGCHAPGAMHRMPHDPQRLHYYVSARRLSSAFSSGVLRSDDLFRSSIPYCVYQSRFYGGATIRIVIRIHTTFPNHILFIKRSSDQNRHPNSHGVYIFESEFIFADEFIFESEF